jgi:prolyl 4-hydroxylase
MTKNRGSSNSSQVLARCGNAIYAKGRRVRILLTLNAPRILLFKGILSASECTQLIELSRSQLERSQTLGAVTGERAIDTGRTSRGAFLRATDSELVARLDLRLSELTGCPVENGEPLQVVSYTPDAEYQPHFDFYDSEKPGHRRMLEHGGQRIGTLLIYLNDVNAGGTTVFPSIGLDVVPCRGNGVYFGYMSEDGTLDLATLHASTPVRGGEKWIATKWFRERAWS